METLRLLSPVQLGPYLLPNRIVMSPMTRNRSPGEVPNALNAEYYAQRASAGLIISESTAISREGLGWPNTPGIFTDEQMDGWRHVTDGVHARGARMFMQLWHCGRNSHPLTQPDGQLPIGPSAIQPTGTVRTHEGRLPLHVPRELPAAEVPRLLGDYKAAAQRAMDAGFDGVEVHAGNGYLLDQFLKDSSNRRQDAYGGDVLKRCRLLLEVVGAVSDVWGPQRVGVRVSPTSPTNYRLSDSNPQLLLDTVLRELSKSRVCYVAVVEGSSNAMPATHQIDYAQARHLFDGPYIANNAFTLASAESALSQGRAELISFGRLFIANPDLVQRFANGAPLNRLNEETIYTPDHRGYTDYPSLDKLAAA
ncbi:MAG: alkene reductase [Proteobacteria bacterium]|nr:alkene reductase [Pseudomonadota bacterium]